MGGYVTAEQQETAVLIGLITQQQTEEQSKEYLDELAFLAETAGAETVGVFTQKLEKPDNATFLGSGKLKEIKAFVEEHEVDMVIFDDDLSSSQYRNIGNILTTVKILDRSNLILDIFASRARTAHSRVQVELAQYEYMLPRLTRMWTHLDRIKGGIGMKGTGETELETDKRIIRDKISLLKKQLIKIDKQKQTQRQGRDHLVRVSLVGYTNVGKSTIMNKLAKSEVFAENKLFATLDTTVRKVVIENLPFLLSDTVGFIRKLPHGLVESFKSTLDEVRESDLLIHVVDVSHSNFEDHIRVVNQTLQEIECLDKPTILVFNKIDAFSFVPKEDDDLTPMVRENYSLDDLKNTWMSKMNDNCIFISAVDKTNFAEFRATLYEKIKAIHVEKYPYHNFLY
jgi:GTP-binding protein HflX